MTILPWQCLYLQKLKSMNWITPLATLMCKNILICRPTRLFPTSSFYYCISISAMYVYCDNVGYIVISTVSGNQSERLNSVTDLNVDWFSIKLYCFQSVRLIFGLIWQFLTYYINVSMIGTALCKIYIMPMV